MAPAISIQIPIYIRNTFAPLEGGTRIFVPRAKGTGLVHSSFCPLKIN